jgi:hypothetical protein
LLGCIHPHIERAIVQEGKTAITVFELVRGNSKVSQDSIHLASPTIWKEALDGREGSVGESNSFAEWGKSFPRAVESICVTINGKKLQVLGSRK